MSILIIEGLSLPIRMILLEVSSKDLDVLAFRACSSSDTGRILMLKFYIDYGFLLSWRYVYLSFKTYLQNDMFNFPDWLIQRGPCKLFLNICNGWSNTNDDVCCCLWLKSTCWLGSVWIVILKGQSKRSPCCYCLSWLHLMVLWGFFKSIYQRTC